MPDVRRSPQAELDLASILKALDMVNPSIAERYALEFEQKARALGQFPEMGRIRSEISPGIRSTIVHPYVLFYRIEDDGLQILRILHGRMDLNRIMKEEAEQ